MAGFPLNYGSLKRGLNGLACAVLFTVFMVFPARAEIHYGLAMHGAPKYAPDFTHLEYVNPEAPKGGKVVRFKVGSFDTLNPYSLKGQAATGLNLFYDRLMARVWDEPFTMYPLIAEKVDVPEDRSSITFFLNPAARFHDGTPVTAQDVLFSYNVLKEKGRPNMRRVYKLVSNVEVRSPHEIHFQLGEGYDQETIMILAMMPVLSEAWWQGRDFNETLLDVPLSSGPYRIKDVKAGQSVTYIRDPDYWGKDLPVNVGHYNFDEIRFDYYRDDTVAFEAFKTGEVDIRREWNIARWATGYEGSDRFVAEALPHKRPERAQGFIFNTRKSPFDDIRVRKALTLALDFNWMNENLFHGLYKRIESYFPNSALAAKGMPSDLEVKIMRPFQEELGLEVFGGAWHAPLSDNPQDVRMNLRQAQALLNEAGWVIVDGVRVRKDDPSQALSFEILLGAPEQEKVALAYARSLERLGIKVSVRVLDSAGFTGRLQRYDYDMVLHYWQNSLSPGTEQLLYWSCDAAKEPSRWNYPGICHPAIDAAAKDIAFAKSREELVAYARVLDRALTWGHYMVPLYFSGKDYVARSHFVKRPQVTPLYGMVMETWWAE